LDDEQRRMILKILLRSFHLRSVDSSIVSQNTIFHFGNHQANNDVSI